MEAKYHPVVVIRRVISLESSFMAINIRNFELVYRGLWMEKSIRNYNIRGFRRGISGLIREIMVVVSFVNFNNSNSNYYNSYNKMIKNSRNSRG